VGQDVQLVLYGELAPDSFGRCSAKSRLPSHASDRPLWLTVELNPEARDQRVTEVNRPLGRRVAGGALERLPLPPSASPFRDRKRSKAAAQGTTADRLFMSGSEC
jgi:hypothetical protein